MAAEARETTIAIGAVGALGPVLALVALVRRRPLLGVVAAVAVGADALAGE